MSSSSLSSLSSLSSESLLPDLVPRRLFILDEDTGVHRPIESSEVAMDGYGTELHLNGQTPYLELLEFENTDPQEGDIWLYQDKLYFHTCGQTYNIPYGTEYSWDNGDWDVPGQHWD